MSLGKKVRGIKFSKASLLIRKLCSKETTQEIDNIGVAFVGVGSEKAAGLKPVYIG